MRNIFKILLFLLVLFLGLYACRFGYNVLSQPSPDKQELYKGVTYQRQVSRFPDALVIHIVKVKVNRGSIRPLVTPADRPKADLPLNARTTSQFLKNSKLQLAVNGGGFHPWWVRGPIYYPHSGDPVAPNGFARSNGITYAEAADEKAPMLIFGGGRPVDIGWVVGSAKNVVSGSQLLVDDGAVVADLGTSVRHPRTAVGVNQASNELIIVVVDGRQPGYSRGVSLQELAQILVDAGAHRAMDLDGGGSSTLVMRGEDGQPVILNSPIHNGIPGRERPVGNHIGFFIK